MTKLQFTPEDFFASAHDMQMSAGLSEKQALVISRMAQAKFDKWLSEAVRVYGFHEKEYNHWFMNNRHLEESDTHRAFLVCIEPIKRECVKHEPKEKFDWQYPTQKEYHKAGHVCLHCGIALVATWTARDE